MSGVTVKQVAELMNVSERTIYMARELQICSPELADKVMAGEISLHAALCIAKPEKYGRKSAINDLKSAWKRASTEERIAFLRWVNENDPANGGSGW